MPGITGRNGLEHLISYLDISGSVSDDQMLRFNPEVKHIQEKLQPERLTLVTFDTRIPDEYVFEKDDPVREDRGHRPRRDRSEGRLRRCPA